VHERVSLARWEAPVAAEYYRDRRGATMPLSVEWPLVCDWAKTTLREGGLFPRFTG
jgi:hypothetical protein